MFPNVGGGCCAETWRVLGLSSGVGLLPAGEEPEHLQSTFKVPLSKVSNPQMLTWGPEMRQPLQRWTLPSPIVYLHHPPVTPIIKKKSFQEVFSEKSGYASQKTLKEIRVVRAVWKPTSWSICWITQQGQQNLGEVLFDCVKLIYLWTSRKAVKVDQEFEEFSDLPKLWCTKNAETTKVEERILGFQWRDQMPFESTLL